MSWPTLSHLAYNHEHWFPVQKTIMQHFDILTQLQYWFGSSCMSVFCADCVHLVFVAVAPVSFNTRQIFSFFHFSSWDSRIFIFFHREDYCSVIGLKCSSLQQQPGQVWERRLKKKSNKTLHAPIITSNYNVTASIKQHNIVYLTICTTALRI